MVVQVQEMYSMLGLLRLKFHHYAICSVTFRSFHTTSLSVERARSISSHSTGIFVCLYACWIPFVCLIKILPFPPDSVDGTHLRSSHHQTGPNTVTEVQVDFPRSPIPYFDLRITFYTNLYSCPAHMLRMYRDLRHKKIRTWSNQNYTTMFHNQLKG